MAAGKRKNNRQSAKRRGNASAVSNPSAATVSAGASSESLFTLIRLPLGLVLALFALSAAPRIHANSILLGSTLAAAAVLLLWLTWLVIRSRSNPAQSEFQWDVVLRPQHYVQAMVQFSVYAYWGYYWQPVYEHALLIVAQLLFAFAFDMLLSWSRGRKYTLGFGPFPIILSINLFLWFRDDWFYMQYLMVAMGFMGKEYVRWIREGRSVHIFNPSAFALGLFSLVLIVTNTTDLTWGQDIASTLTLAPSIYSFLFLVGLIVMYFFSITLVASMAAITLFGLSAFYSLYAGVPYFFDSEIPAAVFLGLHLLITDPSTSPRTALGKSLFGVLYALGVFGLYSLLGAIGIHTFYDKLLCVPLLNLSVIAIDRGVRSIQSDSWLNMWNKNWLGGRANLAHMSLWIGIFLTMSLLGRTDAMHRGDSVPFWQLACAEGRSNACTRLVQLESTYCGDNSAWACNELALKYREGEHVDPDPNLATRYFSRACELKFQAGCLNLLNQDISYRDDPHPLDLRLLLREGGLNLMEWSERDLYAKACEHDWRFACSDSATAGG